jgi:hypothetical protein
VKKGKPVETEMIADVQVGHAMVTLCLGAEAEKPEEILVMMACFPEPGNPFRRHRHQQQRPSRLPSKDPLPSSSHCHPAYWHSVLLDPTSGVRGHHTSQTI